MGDIKGGRFTKNKLLRFFFLFIVLNLININTGYSQRWRSSLYPQDWYPGYTDNQGRFLHDFSYAGYHAGEKEIPDIQENIVDVTEHPYNADNSGNEDVTSIIQQALNDVGQEGGGVVYLPDGNYSISVSEEKHAALHIQYDNTILRGAGISKTRIVNTTTEMRGKSIILVDGLNKMRWTEPEINMTEITENINKPTTKITVASTYDFEKNDLIVIRTDVTDRFISDHYMDNMWNTSMRGVIFYRKIVEVDHLKGFIYLDAPTRYYLKTRDNARVYKVSDPIQEIGLEKFSIGNIENDKKEFDAASFREMGTGAYDVHNSQVINILGTVNSWISKVNTFSPKQNQGNFHILSNGILIQHSRHITVEYCDFQKSQFKGGGGNGYMYTLEGNDCLLRYNIGGGARRNYSFKGMASNGNVIYRCTGNESYLSSDFHMHLSIANLVDNFNVNGDYFEAYNRPNLNHGHTTSQSVFWNTYGINYHKDFSRAIIYSQQFGWGYIIGTRGDAPYVHVWGGDGTGPVDFVEGIGGGNYLHPKSLYTDQLNRRLLGEDYIDEVSDEIGILVYPNPIGDFVQIYNELGFSIVKIVNTSGQVVINNNFGHPVYFHKILTNTLPVGIYILALKVNGSWHSQKLLKN